MADQEEVARVHEENRLPDELQDVRNFLADYGRPIAIGLTIAVLVTAGTLAYKHRAASNIEHSQRLLFSAQTLQDLEALVDQYPSTASAILARLRIAKIYYDSGNYDAALSKYVEFESMFPDHPMAAAAALGRIECLEARSQFEQAEQAYSSFAKDHVGHYLAPLAILGRGRCLQQMNRYADAKALYEDFIVACSNSAWRYKAEEELSKVKKKLGEPVSEPAPTEHATDISD